MLPTDPQVVHALARLKTDPELQAVYQLLASRHWDIMTACITAGGDPVLAGRAQSIGDLINDIDNAAQQTRAASLDVTEGFRRAAPMAGVSGPNGASSYVY